MSIFCKPIHCFGVLAVATLLLCASRTRAAEETPQPTAKPASAPAATRASAPADEPRELDDIEADDKKPAKDKAEDKPLDPNKKRDDAQFELQEWSVWLADPTVQQVNGTDRYPSTMPGIVDTSRSRKQPKQKKSPSPLAMITFHGRPAADIDLDLGVQSGRFVAHWPPAEPKSSRLRWLSAALDSQPDEKAQLAFVAPDHWLTKARSLDSLYLRRGARTERSIVYDAELSYALPVKLKGGPDKYEVTNTGNTTLYDVVIVVDTPEGRRVGWLDELPPAKPAAAKPTDGKPAEAKPGEAKPAGAEPAGATPAIPLPAPTPPPPQAAAGGVTVVTTATVVIERAVGTTDAVDQVVEVQSDEVIIDELSVPVPEGAIIDVDDDPFGNCVVTHAQVAVGVATAAVAADDERAKAEAAEGTAKDAAVKAEAAKAAAAKAAAVKDAVKAAPAVTPADKKADAPKSDAPKPDAPKTAPPANDPPAPVGVTVTMSVPLKADSAEFKQLTSPSLTARLVKAGLKQAQAELLVSIYAEAIFSNDALTVAWRMPAGFMEEKFPITVYPEPIKSTRVAMFIATNLDPKINDDLQGLIAKMGDPKYKEREAAMQRLMELGPLAFPALKQALANPDAEISMRAERVLLDQKQSVDIPDAAKAIKQAGGLIQRVFGN